LIKLGLEIEGAGKRKKISKYQLKRRQGTVSRTVARTNRDKEGIKKGEEKKQKT